MQNIESFVDRLIENAGLADGNSTVLKMDDSNQFFVNHEGVCAIVYRCKRIGGKGTGPDIIQEKLPTAILPFVVSIHLLRCKLFGYRVLACKKKYFPNPNRNSGETTDLK